MKVNIDFNKENLNAEEIEAVENLQYEIQQQINIIPCLKELNSTLNIENIKFDENENIIFDVIAEDYVMKQVQGHYDMRYDKLSDWQEDGEIGLSIGYLLVDIAKKKTGIQISYIERGYDNCISIKQGDYIRIGVYNGYECLATTNNQQSRILDVDNFPYDKDTIYFNGHLYKDFLNSSVYNKFKKELKESPYYLQLDCEYEILEKLDQYIIKEIDIFWAGYNINLKNFNENVFEDIINDKEQNYVIMTYKGKDFFIMPQILGEDDSLNFQIAVSQENKNKILQQFQLIKEGIIEYAIEQVREDFGERGLDNLNYFALPENRMENYLKICNFAVNTDGTTCRLIYYDQLPEQNRDENYINLITHNAINNNDAKPLITYLSLACDKNYENKYAPIPKHLFYPIMQKLINNNYEYLKEFDLSKFSLKEDEIKNLYKTAISNLKENYANIETNILKRYINDLLSDNDKKWLEKHCNKQEYNNILSGKDTNLTIINNND